MRPRTRRAVDELGLDQPPVLKPDAVRANRRDRRALDQIDPCLRHRRQNLGAGLVGHARKSGGLVDQRDLAAPVLQRMRHRHGQFRASNPRADHGDLGCLGGGTIGGPLGRKLRQGFGGNPVLGEARQLGHLGSDPHIHRRQVIGHRRLPRDADLALFDVDPLGRADNHAGAGKAAEAHEVNVELIAGVVPRDETWEHPGIGGCRQRVDHGHPHPRQGVHPPHPQDKGVAMAATNQNKITGQGNGALHGPDIGPLCAFHQCQRQCAAPIECDPKCSNRSG